MSNIIALTNANFDDILAKHKLLLIDFWAKWCAPCKDLQKVIEQVAVDYPEFVFASVDIEAEKELADEFNIRSVPSVMILRDDVVVFAESGAMTAEILRDLLNQTKSLDPGKLEEQKAKQ